MNEFLLYAVLPVLVAIAGVSAYYAIKDGNATRRAEEATLPQQPKPIRQAEYYMKNGHWIFGVRSDVVVQERTLPVLWLGRGGYQCHEHHQFDCGV